MPCSAHARLSMRMSMPWSMRRSPLSFSFFSPSPLTLTIRLASRFPAIPHSPQSHFFPNSAKLVPLVLAVLLGPLLHVDGVRVLVGLVVLGPDLDGLVGFARDEAAAGEVEAHGVDARLGVEGPRLHDGVHLLEAVARFVVPEVEAPVVAPRHEHPVLVHRGGVDDGVVPRQVAEELPVARLPLFEVVRGAAHEAELPRVRRQRPHRLLVVRQRRHALARRQIPDSW